MINYFKVIDLTLLYISAILHAGMGQLQLDKFLSAINVPTISRPALRSREKETGPSIIKVANASCEKALTEEIRNDTATRFVQQFEQNNNTG